MRDFDEAIMRCYSDRCKGSDIIIERSDVHITLNLHSGWIEYEAICPECKDSIVVTRQG